MPAPAGVRRRITTVIGMDRPIAFTVMGRLIQGLGSVATVLLIVHFLTAEQQGYYYALWSLVALQSVFELGFSFVILQVAAHERALVEIHPDGAITGSSAARNRLASALQKAVKWYLGVAVIMGVALLIGGMEFFSLHHAVDTRPIWVGPLRATVIACVVTFSIGPVISFIEGCGQVAAVCRMRFFQSLAGTSAAWVALLSHHGLFAPGMVLVGQGAVALGLIYTRRGLLFPLFRLHPGEQGISWGREVWPFQWKIAVSWLCDYFVFQLITPVLFAFRGPAEAGRMGLSMNIVTQVSAIMLAWMTTKAAPFGQLIARKQLRDLDGLFFRTMEQSVSLFAAVAVVLVGGASLAPHIAPKLSERIVSWPVFLLLILTAMGSHIIQSEAIYLRSHKREPFLVQSIVIALSMCVSVLFLARASGTVGVAFAYFLVLGVGGSISATMIFVRQRAKRRYAKAA
ncbi:MAG TPA: hypothetical protein VKR52_00615 [Terracidiphilus sp.]|nr:hypothetical protein [Terracidiphilus sp.]